MRVTGPLIKVLTALLDAAQAGDDVYGLDLSRRTGVKAGTLSPILARMEQSGWVSVRLEHVDPSVAGRPRRKYYALTGLGAYEARQILAEYGIGAVRWA
jgi:DNA-binding PadR family transcriptional regulator